LRLESTAAILNEGLKRAAENAKVPVCINRVGSIMSCFFTDKPVENFDDVQNTNIKMFKKFFAEMLKNGVYLAPSAYEAMFVSLAHSEEDVEKTIEIAQNVFAKIAR
jgi:glutamate-1-semialdehyde 2,1-aminomutase